MADKPIGVMPLCIIAIFLGIMGFLGGAVGLVTLVINPKTQMPPDPNPKLAGANAEFQRRMEKVTDESRGTTKIVLIVGMLASALLAASGIAGVKLKGLALLKLAFGTSLLVDGGAAVFNMIVQMKILEISKWYTKELAGASDVGSGVAMGMQVGMYVALFSAAGWLVVKTAYYIVGLVYFSKKKVRDAFAGLPPAGAT